jgi:hypothetical protein
VPERADAKLLDILRCQVGQDRLAVTGACRCALIRRSLRQDATLDQVQHATIWFGARGRSPWSHEALPDLAKAEATLPRPQGASCLGFCDVAPSRRPMATPSANINPKLREERKAAENAKAILGTLTPSAASNAGP